MKSKSISKLKRQTSRKRPQACEPASQQGSKKASQKNSHDFSKVYREFSRQKYNKYKSQFPKLRESEIVTKVLKEWDQLGHEDKQKIRSIYQDKGFIGEQGENSSEELRIAQKNNKQSMRLARQSARKLQEQQKNRPITLFYNANRVLNQDNSDFNRHSEKDESQRVQSSYSVVVLPQKKPLGKPQKRKTIRKNLVHSSRIKKSPLFENYWRLYGHFDYKNGPIAMKRQTLKASITKKVKKRAKTQKIKVYRRLIRKNIQKDRKRDVVQFKVVYNKKQSRFEGQQRPKITQSSPYILCHQCNQLINEQKPQACKRCSLVFHNQCSKMVRKVRYCIGCDFDGQTSQLNVSLPQELRYQHFKERWLISSPKVSQGQQKQLKQLQQRNESILRKRLGCSYTFYNRYAFRFQKYLIPEASPVYPKLSQQDMQVVQRMSNLITYPPIQLKRHQKIDGFGAFASRLLKKHELIGTYSGDVLSSSFIHKVGISSQYMMALCEGLSKHTTWSICPFKNSSFGPLLNCALTKKQANVETLMCISEHQFLILMRAQRNIKKGEELLYQYNGRLQEYDTSKFTKI